MSSGNFREAGDASSLKTMESLVRSLPASIVTTDIEHERASFEDLVRRYGRSVYRMAYRLTGNEADTEDLVQDTLIEALKAFSRFQPGSRFDRWIYRIMSNTFIDTVRKRRRHPLVSLDAPDYPWPADQAPGPDQVVLREEQHALVRQALATLPPEFRLAVALVDLEGLSYEEASAMMHCALGTVRSRLHRGRLLLRRRLERQLRGE